MGERGICNDSIKRWRGSVPEERGRARGEGTRHRTNRRRRRGGRSRGVREVKRVIGCCGCLKKNGFSCDLKGIFFFFPHSFFKSVPFFKTDFSPPSSDPPYIFVLQCSFQDGVSWGRDCIVHSSFPRI